MIQEDVRKNLMQAMCLRSTTWISIKGTPNYIVSFINEKRVFKSEELVDMCKFTNEYDLLQVEYDKLPARDPFNKSVIILGEEEKQINKGRDERIKEIFRHHFSVDVKNIDGADKFIMTRFLPFGN